jgi:Gly-Xaa carboxypeptidase
MNLSAALSTVLTAVATLLIPHPGFWTNVQPELSIELTSDATWPSLCPQVDALLPDTHSALLATLNGVYKTEEFKLGVYEKLGGAVGIPCVRSPHLLRRSLRVMHSQHRVLR